MKGFKLTHNDKTVTSTIKNGVTVIFVNKIVTFSGRNRDIESNVTWYKSEVMEGDKIEIEVVDNDAYDKPVSVHSSKSDPLEDELYQLNALKGYLEREGLIEK